MKELKIQPDLRGYPIEYQYLYELNECKDAESKLILIKKIILESANTAQSNLANNLITCFGTNK